MAAVAAALGFRGPLAAPGRWTGFVACRPLRKSIHAAPLRPQPRQAPAPLPQAARRRGAQPPRSCWSWVTSRAGQDLQDRLFQGGILLIFALLLYLGGFPTAGYMLAIALLVMLRPF